MTQDNIQTAIDAGKGLAAKVEIILGIPTLVGPHGALPLAEVLKLSDARASEPRRRTGTATLQAIDSFCEHVNRFKSEASAVFADEANRQFVGVLNYHPSGAESAPAWGDHRALYKCPLSDEWKTWGGGEERRASQDQFALWLDAHDRDLATNTADANGNPYPSPADLMTLAATLEAYSNSKSRRTRDPANGRISVEYTAEDGVKGGLVTIPRAFAIRIPVFTDSALAPIEVRLRVEISDGKAAFVFGIHDATKVLRAAFGDLVQLVRDAVALPVFIGTPE